MSHTTSGGNAAVLTNASRSVMAATNTTNSRSHSSVSTANKHLKDGVIDLVAGTLGGVANVYAGQVGSESPTYLFALFILAVGHCESQDADVPQSLFELDRLFKGHVPT